MTFIEKIYLWNIIKGMWITFKHIWKRKETVRLSGTEHVHSALYSVVCIF